MCLQLEVAQDIEEHAGRRCLISKKLKVAELLRRIASVLTDLLGAELEPELPMDEDSEDLDEETSELYIDAEDKEEGGEELSCKESEEAHNYEDSMNCSTLQYFRNEIMVAKMRSLQRAK